MSRGRRLRASGGDSRKMCRSQCRVRGCLEPRAIVAWSSGGGKTRTASRSPLVGRLEVAEKLNQVDGTEQTVDSTDLKLIGILDLGELSEP